MERWFKDVGRPALFDALAGVCDRIDNELDTGLKPHLEENARLSAELENLRSRDTDVDRLEKETRSLKQELQDLKNIRRAEASTIDQSRHLNDTGIFRSPLAQISVNQVSNPKRSIESGKPNLDELKFSELKEEYRKLDGNYTKLHKKYSDLEGAHTKLNGRLRDVTKAYNRWMDHANQLNELCKKRSRTIKKLEAKLEAATVTEASGIFHERPSDSDLQTPGAQQGNPPELDSTDIYDGLGLQRTTVPREVQLKWPPTHGAGTSNESLRSTASASASPKPSRIEHELRIGRRTNSASRSEGCVIRADRETPSLPPLPQDRNTNPKEVLVKNEPSSDTPVIVAENCLRKRKHDSNRSEDIRASSRVKVEDGGSDPVLTNERRPFVPHESIDFDADGDRVDTPRKRRKANLKTGDTSVRDFAQDSWSLFDKSPSVRGKEHLVEHAARQDGPHWQPLDEISDDKCIANSAIAAPESHENRSSALKPIKRNALLWHSTDKNYSAEGAEPSSLQNGLANLAEDGDQYGVSRTNAKQRRKARRLRDLLNATSPECETIVPLPTAQPDRMRTPKSLGFQVPQRRELPVGSKGVLARVSKTSQSPHTPEAPGKRTPVNINTSRGSYGKTTSDATGNAIPLRERPKSQLGLNDFKVNPNANEGYDYAFTDVVRSKDERASLAGCVQEGCCGQAFRVQARVQRDQTNLSDFQVLLEKHLGDDAWKLAIMAKQEKEEMWLEAKTQELANEHGRHRHRFHRAASPVGFWRADFPSTQEEQQDKEEATKMTRQIIDQRYREAMRPGGRWLFRDE